MASTKHVLEVTLAIIKPHIVKRPCDTDAIRDIIVQEGFKVIKTTRKLFTLAQLEIFYNEHKKKFFYNRLLDSMLCGPSDFYILAHNNAINHWRKLLGPTKVYQAQISDPKCIRSQFGVSDTRNAAHGSDSLKSAKREIEVIFGTEFDWNQWYENEESRYRNDDGNLKLNKKIFLHYF